MGFLPLFNVPQIKVTFKDGPEKKRNSCWDRCVLPPQPAILKQTLFCQEIADMLQLISSLYLPGGQCIDVYIKYYPADNVCFCTLYLKICGVYFNGIHLIKCIMFELIFVHICCLKKLINYLSNKWSYFTVYSLPLSKKINKKIIF